MLEKMALTREYSRFVAKMRRRISSAKGSLTEKELEELLNECVDEGILVDFLKTYGTEVISMLFTEMTVEEVKDLAREDGYEEGREEGRREGREEGYKEIARNLKGKGMSLEDIAEVTGLTTEEIKAL